MSDRLPAVANCTRCTVLKFACYTHARSTAPHRDDQPRTNNYQDSMKASFQDTRKGVPVVGASKQIQPPPVVDDEDEFPELGAAPCR